MLSPHVLTGYRIGHSPADLIASMLTLHNETGNIWTHLTGGILYAYFWTTNILTVEGMTWVDIRFGQFMLLLGMVMFVCSTMYHTMKDNWLDKSSTSYFLQFDFVGVRLFVRVGGGGTLGSSCLVVREQFLEIGRLFICVGAAVSRRFSSCCLAKVFSTHILFSAICLLTKLMIFLWDISLCTPL